MRPVMICLLFGIANEVNAGGLPKNQVEAKPAVSLDINRIHRLNEKGISTTGELTSEDSRDTALKDSPCRIYRVILSEGQNYSIHLKSKSFDSFLRIENAIGKELARDDDGGGDFNARIEFRCSRSGLYQIIVTSFDHRGGEYAFFVKPTDLKKNP